MTAAPAGLVPYRTTPVFTAGTVPEGLTRSHRTGVGVWGRIDVLAGELELARFAAGGGAPSRETLRGGDSALVRPGEPHAVAPGAGARFSVTFLREGGPGAAGG